MKNFNLPQHMREQYTEVCNVIIKMSKQAILGTTSTNKFVEAYNRMYQETVEQINSKL